jgi:hypothetical protein
MRVNDVAEMSRPCVRAAEAPLAPGAARTSQKGTLPYCQVRSGMTKCVKPFRHLATSISKSYKWSARIDRAGTKLV